MKEEHGSTSALTATTNMTDPWMQPSQYPNRDPEASMSPVKKFTFALPIAIVVALFVVVGGALWLMNEADKMQDERGAFVNPNETEKLQLLTTLYSDAGNTSVAEKAAVLDSVSASAESDVSAQDKLRLLESLQAQ